MANRISRRKRFSNFLKKKAKKAKRSFKRNVLKMNTLSTANNMRGPLISPPRVEPSRPPRVEPSRPPPLDFVLKSNLSSIDRVNDPKYMRDKRDQKIDELNTALDILKDAYGTELIGEGKITPSLKKAYENYIITEYDMKYYPVSAHDMNQYKKRETRHIRDVKKYKNSEKFKKKMDTISMKKIQRIVDGRAREGRVRGIQDIPTSELVSDNFSVSDKNMDSLQKTIVKKGKKIELKEMREYRAKNPEADFETYRDDVLRSKGDTRLYEGQRTLWNQDTFEQGSKRTKKSKRSKKPKRTKKSKKSKRSRRTRRR